MEITGYLEKKREIHQYLMKYFEENDNVEENYHNLVNCLENQKIQENKYEIRDFIHLISKISNNHYRNSTFYDKIKQLLTLYKIDIQQAFSNYGLFDIFKRNKRILLFLFDEKFIIPDSLISSTITSQKFIKANYASYFYPEFKTFFTEFMLDRIKKEDEKFTETIELFENIKDVFNENRKIGENDSEICRIIREDSIEEFITFVNSKQISLSMAIQPSIFETNPFLIKRKPLLIEYSAFFGSIQIFKYLFDNIDKSMLSPSSLWIYAIHGQNPELIQFFIDNKFGQLDEVFKNCVLESLKCHHIEITNYLKENDLYQKVLDNDSICLNCLKNYNYIFLSNDLKDQKDIFFYLCKYDHYSLADLFLKTTKIDINAKVISLKYFFKYSFKLKFV